MILEITLSISPRHHRPLPSPSPFRSLSPLLPPPPLHFPPPTPSPTPTPPPSPPPPYICWFLTLNILGAKVTVIFYLTFSISPRPCLVFVLVLILLPSSVKSLQNTFDKYFSLR